MSESKTWTVAEILGTVRRYWGFSELRPLQEEAIRAGLDRRDSLVVMPTGGGKSLCYQVPPELAQRKVCRDRAGKAHAHQFAHAF